jgi:hypothetical protein
MFQEMIVKDSELVETNLLVILGFKLSTTLAYVILDSSFTRAARLLFEVHAKRAANKHRKKRNLDLFNFIIEQ